MSYMRRHRRDLLADVLVHNPSGLTLDQIDRALPGCTKSQIRQAVHDLRRLLSASAVNVVCDPGTWIYRLAATPADAAPWMSNRMRDAETRISTMRAVATSIAASVPANSRSGRRARVMVRALTRLEEDLGDIA